jgi:hypothetical protein
LDVAQDFITEEAEQDASQDYTKDAFGKDASLNRSPFAGGILL